MSTAPPIDGILDRNYGYFTMIPNIIFKLGLSTQARDIYLRLKWKAGAHLQELPANQRRISALLEISRSSWTQPHGYKELNEAGLVYIERNKIILTDVQLINARYFAGKMSITKAKEAIRKLVPRRNLGPNLGQNLGPNLGHMTKEHDKNKNMGPISSSLVSTNGNSAKSANDDGIPRKQRFPVIPISAKIDRQEWFMYWFSQLSGGGFWKEQRDRAAWQKLVGYPPAVLLLALCHAVARSAKHKITSPAYMVDIAAEFNRDMAGVDVIDHVAARTVKKTLKMIEIGKWNLADMTDAEQTAVIGRESRS